MGEWGNGGMGEWGNGIKATKLTSALHFELRAADLPTLRLSDSPTLRLLHMDPLLVIFRVAVVALAAWLWWWGRRQAAEAARLRGEVEALEAEAEVRRESLRTAQDQLVQARKMASLGQLTAGIAHEIKNPLNFVQNFARLLVDLTGELREELAERRDRPAGEVLDEVGDLLDDLTLNAGKISEHGQRADATVRSMLMHSRSNDDQRQAVDLNALVRQYAGLAYHGMRAADPHFNVDLNVDLDPAVGHVEIVPQEIGRVLINLLNNAFFATHERAEADEAFRPAVGVQTAARDGEVEISVADNGGGIPETARARIFEPFFTTKPVGAGTGLGLSLSYEIVTAGHGGTLGIETEEGEGTTFVMALPQTPVMTASADREAADG